MFELIEVDSRKLLSLSVTELPSFQEQKWIVAVVFMVPVYASESVSPVKNMQSISFQIIFYMGVTSLYHWDL